MPYHLEKVGRKYLVITTATGKAHSKLPMTKKKAEAQLRILNAHTDVVEHLGGFVNSEGNLIGPTTQAENIGYEVATAFAPMGAFELAGVYANPVGALASVGAVQAATAEETQAAANKQSSGIDKFYTSLGIKTPGQAIAEQQAAKEAERAKEFQAWFNQSGLQDKLAKAAWAREASANASSLAAAELRGRSGVDKVYSEKELQEVSLFLQKNAQQEAQSRQLYQIGNRKLIKQLNDERAAKQREAANEQNQQYLSGLNEQSMAIQRQTTSSREATEKARLLQQQRFQDQKLFLTKANDIRRRDFFDKERNVLEARRALIDAEQRRQAIKAAAAQRAAAPPSGIPASTTSGMIPTLGRRLPPSVLWHG